MFVFCLLLACAIHANAHDKNEIGNVKDYVLDTGLRKLPIERRIFTFKRNGVRIDMKIVPSAKDEAAKNKNDDYFPEFPVKDIGKCILELSLGCIKKRFVRFLEAMGRLDEISLLGQDMKLVKNRAVRKSDGRAMNNTEISIENSIDDFFDSFTLRITLPRWNSKREKNQIDVTMDDTAVAEGRGKKGGGGGCGGGKGGKCKMMMMGMLMMVKMKLMGLAAMKGMMMGGMSLMITMMMLSQKFGKGGGGGGIWQSGGGGGGGGGGGNYKEIVLLTKSSGGGGGGGGGGPSDSYGAPPSSSYGAPPSSSYGAPPSSSYGAPPSSSYGAPPSSSYGAPPSSSYGAPSGGGYGGGGGGSGWGRSFDKRPMMLSYDNAIKAEIADGSNPRIGEITSKMDSVDYPDYQDYQYYQEPIANSDFMTSNSKATDYIAARKYEGDVSADSVKTNSKSTVGAKGRNLFNKTPPTNVVNIIEKNVDSITSTNQPVIHETNVAYMDEWQATAEKVSSTDASLSLNSNVRESRQINPRSRDVPLLRGI